MDRTSTSSKSKLPLLEQSLRTFPRFPDLPTEVRLMVWRAAIFTDFSNIPISIKPYSVPHSERLRGKWRITPKTSRINRESRQVTLKYFRRLELQPSSRPAGSQIPGTQFSWLPRVLEPQFVLWNKEIDVLALDWWCLVANVTDVVSYLRLGSFVDGKGGTISCVQTLSIDAEHLNARLGSSRLAETIENKLCHFVSLRRVQFLNWPGYRTAEELEQLLTIFNRCFQKPAERNLAYSIPMIYTDLQRDKYAGRFY